MKSIIFCPLGRLLLQSPIWAGKQCGLPCATCAGTRGYRKVRTRQIARPRNAVQRFGTRAVLTAGRGQHGSKRGVAAERRRRSTDNATSLLLQPRVLRFGLFQDGDIGVGVFPEGEEIFVGSERPDAEGMDWGDQILN